MIMSLLAFTIVVVIFGVVTSQNHDVNSQITYGKRSVEATTAFPPDPTVQEEGMRILLTRLETLCVEKLEYLITDTNKRFQSLENQLSQSSSCPASPVVQNNENLEAKVENLGKSIQDLKDFTRNLPLVEKLEYLIADTNKHFQSLENQSAEVNSTVETIRDELGRMSQCSTSPATPVDQDKKNLEAKVENLMVNNIPELMDATGNLSSDVTAIKRNDSSLINVTRSLGDLPSNSELKQIFPEELQAPPSTPFPLILNQNHQYPKNCKEVQESKKTAFGSDKTMIQPEGASKPFVAVCDFETRGGGWTVIQKRFDGSQDFTLDWQDYKNGFGNLEGEFWLGLENIHLLTRFEVNELLIELGDFESNNISAHYSEFRLASEMDRYSIQVLGAYSGDSGDSLNVLTNNWFNTKDTLIHKPYRKSCNKYNRGSWWHSDCAACNLNGKYWGRDLVPDKWAAGVYWNSYRTSSALKHTRMLVRPKV